MSNIIRSIRGSQEFKETTIANAALSSSTVVRYIRLKLSAESNGSIPACIGYVKNKLTEKEPEAVYGRLQENLNVTKCSCPLFNVSSILKL